MKALHFVASLLACDDTLLMKPFHLLASLLACAHLPTRTVSGTTRSPMPTLRLPTSLTSHPYLLLVIMGADEVVSSATNLLTKSSTRQTMTGRVMSLKAALTLRRRIEKKVEGVKGFHRIIVKNAATASHLLKKSTTMFSLCFPPSPPAAAP